MKPILALGVAILVSAASRVLVPAPAAASTAQACSVVLQPQVTLGEAADPVDLAPLESIAVDGRGRYLAIALDEASVLVFDRAGRHAATVGRRGGGPGEFGLIRSVLVGPGDTVLVVDRIPRRITVLGPDLTLVRTLPIELNVDHALLDGTGGYLAHAQVPTPEGAGFPLHSLGPRGELRRSWGARDQTMRPDRALEQARVISVGPGRRVVAAHRRRFEIERWSAAGEYLGGIGGGAPLASLWRGSSGSAGISWIAGVRERRDAVWVSVRRLRQAPPPAQPGREPARVTDPEAFESAVLAFDPASGRQLGGLWQRGVLGLASPADFVTELRHTTDGRHLMRLHRYALRCT